MVTMTQDNQTEAGSEGFNAYNEANIRNLRRFPDYILCCQLNLHKSPECAASLAKYIDRQWDYLRVNHNGIISSKQLEINRNPDAFGGKKDGKPLTVTEWEKMQKEKSDLKLRKLAELERTPRQHSGARGTGRGRSRGRGTKRGGGRGTRGTGTGSASRGRGRGRGRSPSTSTTNSSRGRGRQNSRQAKSPLSTPKTPNVKAPRLAKRNLRDKGQQLPRRRGPDKPPKPSQIPLLTTSPQALSGAEAQVEDAMVPDELYNDLLQVDGNISDISDSASESNADSITFSQSDLPENQNNLIPLHQSTQISQLSDQTDSDTQEMGQIELAGLDSMLREIRNEANPITPPTPDSNDANSTIDETSSPPPSPPSNTDFPSQNSILEPGWARHEEQFGVSPSAFLVAVQEPCTFLQRVVNISGATVIMDPKADVVRAALICSVHLDIWPDTEFCSGDMVTCLLRTKRYGEIYVVSLYCDADEQPIPDKLKALLNKARREGKEVLVMGDFNAHSYACWNSKKTDARGRAWEQLISDKGLRVLNRGDKFTFIASTGQTIVDVCLATPKLARLARHFATIDHVPSSDHVLNEFMLLTEDCWSPRPPGYNLRECKTQWLKLHAAMEEKPSRVLGNIWTPADLDLEGPGIEEDLHSLMAKYSQPSNTITRIYPIAWWSK